MKKYMYMTALALIMAMPSADASAAGKEYHRTGMEKTEKMNRTGMRRNHMEENRMGMEKSRMDRMHQNQTAQNRARQLQSETIREIQKALNEKGFDAGDVDGIWGNNTRTALMNFQRARGLKTTGSPGQDTLSRLGIEKEGTGNVLRPENQATNRFEE